MTSRWTSADAYREIEEKGLLSHLRFEVYKTLYTYGPLTQGELWVRHFLNTHQRHSICPRIAELEKMGCVESVGERECTYSGVMSMLWDVTEHLPRPLLKGADPTKVDLINALCEQIETITDRIETQASVDWSTWYCRSRGLLESCLKHRKKTNRG